MVGRTWVRVLLVASLFLTATACTDKKIPSTAAPRPPVGAPATLPSALVTPQDLAAQPGGLETVRIAYTLLIEKYYKPLKSNDLLRAAWDGVVQEASRRGNADSGSAPKLTGDRDADFKAFGTSFNSVAGGDEAAQYAFAAVNAMARSLGDDHTAFLGAELYKRFAADGSSADTRDVFTSKLLADGIGYLKLSRFPAGYQKLDGGKTLAELLDDTLSHFESQGVRGWILDLRNDGGGHTESISTVAGRFIPDGLQEIDLDSKGERFEVPFDGHYFTHPHPLAVLINGGSGSASEITAAALRDYGAARLFGTRTAGAVNGAEIFPLPGQVGLEYTVVEVLAGKSGTALDKVGVQPDESVSQRATGDAQLEAAQTWLRTATAPPQPPVKAASVGALNPDQIRSHVGAYAPAIADIPHLPDLRELGDVVLTTPNEYVVWAPCSVDAAQMARTVVDRGWQGQYDSFFGNGDPFTYQVGIDIYKDSAGAGRAFQSNDCPQGLEPATIPVRLGDESVAMKGTGVLRGWTQFRWRRGRIIFSTYYYSEPGLESFDPLLQIAKAIDTRYDAKPLK